jgi:hypothetical protein
MVTDSVPSEEITTTTDHETIRTWVERRGSMPARVNESAGNDPGSLAIMPKGKEDDSLLSIPWEEFFETFESERLAFAYQTEKADPNTKWFCQFVARDAERTDEALLDAESDDSWRLEATTETERQLHRHSTPEVGLEEGDTAETAITRRRIVEREIIETDHFRSRVVNSETIDETVLDSEILDMEIDRTEIIGRTTIETEIITHAAIRTELEERYLVESELIERETVERELTEEQSTSRETEGAIEADSIEQETVEGEVFDDPASRRSVVESEVVRRAIAESELEEGEVIQTEVIARRIVESEVVERLLVTTALVGGEVIDHEFVESEVVDMEIIEERRDRKHAREEPASGALESTPADTEISGITDGTTNATDATENRTVTAADEGKDVRTAEGERVGRIVAVHDGLLYLDVEADLAESVASRFDWENHDEAVPIELERVDRVTDEAVYLGEFTAQP